MIKSISYLEWVKSIPASDKDLVDCQCPSCEGRGLSYQYFGLAENEFGWKIVWCDKCLTGIRISRVKLSGCEKVLVNEDEQSAFLEKYSNLNLIF